MQDQLNAIKASIKILQLVADKEENSADILIALNNLSQSERSWIVEKLIQSLQGKEMEYTLKN